MVQEKRMQYYTLEIYITLHLYTIPLVGTVTNLGALLVSVEPLLV